MFSFFICSLVLCWGNLSISKVTWNLHNDITFYHKMLGGQNILCLPLSKSLGRHVPPSPHKLDPRCQAKFPHAKIPVLVLGKEQKAHVFIDSVAPGWGTCCPREHLIWPASNFSLPKQQHIASKRNHLTTRHVDTVAILELKSGGGGTAGRRKK